MSKQFGGALFDFGDFVAANRRSPIPITRENYPTIDYNLVPEEPGAFDGLRFFNELFGGNVSVVYNATRFADERIQRWCDSRRLHNRTGIPRERVFRTATGRDKTAHLLQESDTHYGTTVQGDNRLEVLKYSFGKVRHLFLYCPPDEVVEEERRPEDLARVHVVSSWDEIIHVCCR